MRYAIVGCGVAGVTAARALRVADPSAEVHIFGEEPYPYYRRPLLWELIAGQIGEDEVFYRPAAWYAEQSVVLHLAANVLELDPATRCLTLADGTAFIYDRLLLATGARSYVPPCTGSERDGVFTLRTLDDALAIIGYMPRSSTAAVIGGGLLGLETARALHSAGLEVTVVEFFPHLLPRQLDAQGASVLQALLEAQGLRFATAAEAEEILGMACASSLRLRDGRTVLGDLVLFSTGVRSETRLARAAGLTVKRGIVVDGHLQTSMPDIYAAGDSAEFEGCVYGIIPPAIEQARVAAANMIAPGTARYAGTTPTTTLKIAGAELTSLGDCLAEEGEGTILRRTDVEAGRYSKLVVRGGRVVGAILLNDRRRLQPISQLVERQVDVSADAERLLDDDYDLRSLLQVMPVDIRGD